MPELHDAHMTRPPLTDQIEAVLHGHVRPVWMEKIVTKIIDLLPECCKAADGNTEHCPNHRGVTSNDELPAVYVRWLDSSMQHSQVDGEDLPSPSLMQTIGWLAETNNDYIVVARDTNVDPSSYRWRSSLAIPKSAIVVWWEITEKSPREILFPPETD